MNENSDLQLLMVGVCGLWKVSLPASIVSEVRFVDKFDNALYGNSCDLPKKLRQMTQQHFRFLFH